MTVTDSRIKRHLVTAQFLVQVGDKFFRLSVTDVTRAVILDLAVFDTD